MINFYGPNSVIKKKQHGNIIFRAFDANNKSIEFTNTA